MRCPNKTWYREVKGPASGGATSYDSGQIHIGKPDERLYVETFCIELFDTALDPVSPADVILEFADYEDDASTLTALRLVDRTLVSVDGQVAGRYVLLFPISWPVPMGAKLGTRSMQPRLQLANIDAGCRAWRAWLATERGKR